MHRLSFRLLFLLLLCLPGGPAVAAGQAPDGARLYAQHCSACHGTNGRGGVGVPLALPDFQAVASDDYFRTTIRMGRPGRVMPAFTQLSDAEIDAIVRHIRSWNPDIRPPRYDRHPVRGDARHGHRLFLQHCARCHGRHGEGGHGTGVTFSRPRELPIIAPALNNIGFLTAAPDAMIRETLRRGRSGTPMVSFLRQGLSEQDIDDIVAYVRSFEREARRQAAARAQPNAPAILVRRSPYGLEETVENVKQAVVGKNFRLIRIQHLEDGFLPPGRVDRRQVIVYFCNFKFLYDALAIDPRVGLFLPCRVTVVEHADGSVEVMSINPRRLSAVFNNERLDEACERMRQTYEDILEEATL
ncbi:MAG: DUF302 domain-containing protein [Gammaproteobacteria bacterium]|nr:MAG: DUF302 domain-containing protein [Gammaproteobacteria bacterium]